MNTSDSNHRHAKLRTNWKLGLGVLAIIAAGVATDATAQFIVNNNAGSDCFICTDAPASARGVCNENNADFVGHCQTGEHAVCSGNSDSNFAVDCKESLQIIQ